MRHLLAVALGSVLATGCMGAVGDEGQGSGKPDAGTVDPTGKMGPTLYANNVHPIMNRCSGGACHNADASSGALGKYYVMGDASATYTKITAASSIVGAGPAAFASTAPILTKIAAGHQGVVYSDDDKSKITAWLSKEVEERKGMGPVTPAEDPKETLRKFSGCLTLADFNTAQMAQKWGAMQADNAQACKGCHAVGTDGFIANNSANIMFPPIVEQTGYMLKFFSVDQSTTPYKVVINTGSFMNAGVTIQSHPRFNPTTNIGMPALKSWYDLAMAKQMAGTCGAPTLKD